VRIDAKIAGLTAEKTVGRIVNSTVRLIAVKITSWIVAPIGGRTAVWIASAAVGKRG
jgi:hypothetical protein